MREPAARRALELLVVAGVYAVLFVALTQPAGSLFPKSIPVDGPDPAFLGDGAMFVWNVDHFGRAVHAGSNPFRAEDLFAPVGTNLWLHTYTPLLGVLGLFTPSPIVAIAIGIAASFVVSGLGAYLFARRFLESRMLSAIAGFVFAFCPFKLARLLGHFNLELTATLPFFALLLLDWHLASPPAKHGVLPLPSLRTSLWGAFLLAVTLASDFYYTYFCLWMIVSTVALRWFEVHPLRWSRRRALLVAAVTLGLSTGLVELYFALGGEAHGAFGYSADVVGYVLPSVHHRWLGGERLLALKKVLRNATIEHEVFAGLTVLVPIFWLLRSKALRLADPRERWLAWFAATFLLLASPVVRIGGIRVLGLPHAVLNMLPLIGNLRVPARFAVVTMLAAGVLAMLGLQRAVFPRLGPKARVAVGCMVLGTLLLEYVRKPFDTLSDAAIPSVYSDLAAKPPGTVLEIPFGVRDGYRSLGWERTSAMLFATRHQKPLIGGMIARLPAAVFDRYEHDPVLGPLLAAQSEGAPPFAASSVQKGAIEPFVRAVDLRYVVIRPEARLSPLGIGVEQLFADRIASRWTNGDWTVLELRR